MTVYDDALKKLKEASKQGFNFLGSDRQWLSKPQYDQDMERDWRNPVYTWGKEPGVTAPVSRDRILREEAARRRQDDMSRWRSASGRPGIFSNATGRYQPQSLGDPSKSGILKGMTSGMKPMDMTRYYKERDNSFAAAVTQTVAGGLAESMKPPPAPSGHTKIGRAAPFEVALPDMASWIAPRATSSYEDVLADPTIETYLRPWRLKHGYV